MAKCLYFLVALVCLGLIESCIFSNRLTMNCNNCGVILHKQRVYDNKTKGFIIPKYWQDLKIWYKDSIVIEESLNLEIKEFNGKEEWKFDVDHYTYIDLRKKWFYEYK